MKNNYAWKEKAECSEHKNQWNADLLNNCYKYYYENKIKSKKLEMKYIVRTILLQEYGFLKIIMTLFGVGVKNG